jgi:hypothetical protein
MASGIMWIRNQNGIVTGFGSQLTGRGAINAILEALGPSSAKRNLEQHRQARFALWNLYIKRKNCEA